MGCPPRRAAGRCLHEMLAVTSGTPPDDSTVRANVINECRSTKAWTAGVGVRPRARVSPPRPHSEPLLGSHCSAACGHAPTTAAAAGWPDGGGGGPRRPPRCAPRPAGRSGAEDLALLLREFGLREHA